MGETVKRDGEEYAVFENGNVTAQVRGIVVEKTEDQRLIFFAKVPGYDKETGEPDHANPIEVTVTITGFHHPVQGLHALGQMGSEDAMEMHFETLMATMEGKHTAMDFSRIIPNDLGGLIPDIDLP